MHFGGRPVRFTTALMVLCGVGLAAWAQPAATIPSNATSPATGTPATAATPLDPFSAVAPARAAAEAARVRLSNARDELGDYVRTQRLLFENSVAYREAVAAQQQAWSAYDEARRRVLDALSAEPTVLELRRLLTETAGQLDARQVRLAESHLSPAVAEAIRTEVRTLADTRLWLSRQLTALESAALRDDRATSEARERLAEATRAVSELRRRFEVELRTGEALAAGRQAVREARVQQAAAAEYAVAAARSADLLLDYAYYVQWSSQRRSVVVASPWVGYAYPLAGTVASAGSITPAGSTPAFGGVGVGYGMMPTPAP